MVDVQANLEIFAALSALGVSLVLLGISTLSYVRLRNPRALIIALGFLVLSGKSAFLSITSWQTRGSQDWVLVSAVLDLTLALLFYFAIRKA